MSRISMIIAPGSDVLVSKNPFDKKALIEFNGETDNVSDGYHTFGELYEHRIALFIALMQSHPDTSWWSRKHSDNSMFDGGWIIAGMELSTGRVTYHLNDSYIRLLEGIKELDNAPEWGGETPADCVVRLQNWAARKGSNRE